MPNLSPQAYSSQTLRSTVPEDFDAYQKFINDRPSIDGSQFYGTPGQRLFGTVTEGLGGMLGDVAERASNIAEHGSSLVDTMKEARGKPHMFEQASLAPLRAYGRTLGDVVATPLDVAGTAASTTLDLASPDELGVGKKIEKAVSSGFNAFLNTPLGRTMSESYAGLSEDNKKDAEAAFNIGGILPLGRAFNAIARNMDTEVSGFYSGNPLLKILGVMEGAVKGTGRAVLSSINPNDISFQTKTGLSRGTVSQAKMVEELVPEAARLKEMGVELDKTIRGQGSYFEGALAYAYLFGRQMDEPVPEFLKKNFEDLNILDSSTQITPESFNRLISTNIKATPDVSTNLSPNLQSLIRNKMLGKTGWAMTPSENANAVVVVKDWDMQHSNFSQQAMKGRGASDANALFFHNFNNKGIDLKTASPEDVVAAGRGRSLTAEDRKIMQKEQEGKPLTANQQKILKEAKKKLDAEASIKWDEDSQVWFLQDSFKAEAKELGGVNRITTMDREGNVTVVVSDRHDMMGFDPTFGRPLITVMPPIRYNVYNTAKTKEGEMMPSRAASPRYQTEETAEQARMRLARELGERRGTETTPKTLKSGGVSQQGRKGAGGFEIGGPFTRNVDAPDPMSGDPVYSPQRAGVTRRIAQRAIQERQNFQPTPRELARASGRAGSNVALGAAYVAPGMLSDLTDPGDTR